MARVLTEDFAEVTLGPITLSNNTWGVDTWGFGHWVNGNEYLQTLRYIPGDLTHRVSVNWSYDNPGGNILAYPELILGYKPWSAAGDDFLVGRVSTLRELMLTTDIDIRGQTDGFNIAYDLWLTDTPKGDHRAITAEVMVWLHPGGFTAAGAAQATLKTAGFSASVYYLPDMAAGTDQSWAYVAVVIDGGRLDGALDMNLILQFLADKGFIDRSDYLSSVELGAEVQTGTGGFTLNSFDWQHSAYDSSNRADRLVGTARADWIEGLGGNDSLIGGAGRDRLWGGAGADRLTGGSGADRFFYKTSAEMRGDKLTDFHQAEHDRIDLRALDAVAGTAANDSFAFIGHKPFGLAAGQLRTRLTAGTTELRGDLDGDGRADFTLILQGHVTLTAEDFLL
jgi:hypothetical protein